MFCRVQLEPNEDVIRFVYCSHTRGGISTALGYLTLTSSRLIFTGSRNFLSLNRLSLPYAGILDIGVARRFNLFFIAGAQGDAVRIQSRDGRQYFFWPQTDAESLADDIERMRQA
jgi:hypothetical protein